MTYIYIGKGILHDINVGGEFVSHTEMRKDRMITPESVWIGGNLYSWRSDCNKISPKTSLTAWHSKAYGGVMVLKVIYIMRKRQLKLLLKLYMKT